MENATFHRIADVARLLDVNPSTLRAWEAAGITPTAARRRGQRIYTPQDVQAIRDAIIERPIQRERKETVTCQG